MKQSYVFYFPGGEIRQVVETSNPTGCLFDDLMYVAGTANPDTDYVDGNTLLVEPKGDYTLEALPLPCTVTIEGVDYPVTEQPTFEFNYPGSYEIKVDAGPAYFKKVFTYDYQP